MVCMTLVVGSSACQHTSRTTVVSKHHLRASHISPAICAAGVLKPPEIKTLREVQAAVGDWEARVARLEEEYLDTLDDSLKVAVLVSYLPEELREKVFEMERGGEDIKYAAAKEVVIARSLFVLWMSVTMLYLWFWG